MWQKLRICKLETYTVLIFVSSLFVLSKGIIDVKAPMFADWDFHRYRLIAEASPHFDKHAPPPFAFRILGPYVIGLLPLPDPLAFRIVNSLACVALVVLFYRFLMNRGIQSRVAFLTTLLFACNRYFFGQFAWNPFQIDDVLALLCFILAFTLMFEKRWLLFACCFVLGSLTREVIMILVPVSFAYLWEQGTLRVEYKKWLLAITPAISVFLIVRIFVYSDDVRMGISGILPYYWMKFHESIGNALTASAWFRRLIWCTLPVTLVPFIFWRTTVSFFARHKYLLLFFVLVIITDLWGIDEGGGDAERQMAPSFLVIYWLIAELGQRDLSQISWSLPLILGGGYIASLHHLQGFYPLRNPAVTLLLSAVSTAGVSAIALYVRHNLPAERLKQSAD